ncbi:MAG: NADP-dependent oxidoreductase [Nitrospinota bacterium]|nr:NADP-dependent oxidoreductase [Nitrospinota bacterium]
MRAMVADGPGGPEVLRLAEVEKPGHGREELLVQVAACGLNPVDYKIRQGYFSQGRVYPAIYGFDVCGQVEAAGMGTAFAPGDEVYYYADLTKQGAYAEYHVVDSAIVDYKPENLTPVEAASLPLAGVTAIQALFGKARLQPMERILIVGAAGGVGSLATQIAAWKGAQVIGVCSRPNMDYVRRLGAEYAVDYTSANLAEEVSRITRGEGVHVALDLVGGESFADCVECLGHEGRLVFLNAFSNWEKRLMETMNRARPKNLAIFCELAKNRGEDMRMLSFLARKGFVKPQVKQVIELIQTPEAHRRLETMRGRGKIVIDLSKD